MSAVGPSVRAMTTGGTDGSTPPSAAAVAVRLRRFWLGEAAEASVVRESDLGAVWREIVVRRLGAELQLWTPYDFGDGDPLDGGLGAYLGERVRELSAGTVRDVVWRYDERMLRPVRRARSTELDVHAPGDPGLEEYADVLGRLRKAIPADTPDGARAVLGELRLAGVSRHRLWFAAPDDAAELAVRRTPGAASALSVAVRHVQKAEPIHRVVVDATIDDLPLGGAPG